LLAWGVCSSLFSRVQWYQCLLVFSKEDGQKIYEGEEDNELAWGFYLSSL